MARLFAQEEMKVGLAAPNSDKLEALCHELGAERFIPILDFGFAILD
ncbi:MAG: hypothetical protein ACFE0I_06650 [Elainellaceae cyanobacterium]